jgi:hypothetical protein
MNRRDRLALRREITKIAATAKASPGARGPAGPPGEGGGSVADGSITTAKMGGDVTTAGKALLTAADAAAQRTALALGTAAQSATGDFAPAVHTHGDLYYTEAEVDALLAALPSGGGQLVVNVHANAAGNITMTNQANAEQFLGNSNRNITKVDLTDYTEVRLVARVVTGSASVNNPRIYAEYHTSFTTTVATYSGIGTSAVSCSLTTAGLVDSGWVALATGAKADVFVTVLQNGGDAGADPALGPVALHFR